MRWTPRCTPEKEELASRLSVEARIAPVLARLLAARGIDSVEEATRFLSPKMEHLHSPYEMLGMRAAIDRLRAAIERKERVLIYGDYDVDGTTAVVILKTAIELCGGTCEFHVPHRIREGYGMRDDVIERAAAGGVSLIISVDTGIRAFAAAETCHRLGLDLIVTDHHLPEADGVPRAVAVLNPNQHGCSYPCKALCGAGVAFKVAQGLLEQYPNYGKLIPSFLKVVAIATIADAVPLVDENRVFAKLGLDGLRSPVNAGLRALMDVADLSGRPIKSGDVAFRLAPRLNAAGRMDVAKDVVDLFTIKDANLAREIAGRLNALNAERQAEEARIVAEIQGQLDRDQQSRESNCIVVDGEGWHKGVIGIVASRVVDRYHRPAVVISREGVVAQGSGRSIEAFHLMEALESCAPLFTRFGGHAHAAGFALPSERIPELRQALCARANERLTPEDLRPVLRYDSEIMLDEVTPNLFEFIEQLEPFGMSNPEPVFISRGVRVLVPPRLLKEKHMKLRVRQEPDNLNGSGRGARVFDLLAWRMADRIQQEAVIAGDALDIAFSVDENQHPEYGGLQLSLSDFSRTGSAPKAAAARAGDPN
ncbi:MAG TPA: single-stranded-DNA-specific exonuclease RecJ [Terriglobales bacterium]|nr:single-stranded-DNA-specific exonuclease RecJ [Terriglobales bacterium]